MRCTVQLLVQLQLLFSSLLPLSLPKRCVCDSDFPVIQIVPPPPPTGTCRKPKFRLRQAGPREMELLDDKLLLCTSTRSMLLLCVYEALLSTYIPPMSVACFIVEQQVCNSHAVLLKPLLLDYPLHEFLYVLWGSSNRALENFEVITTQVVLSIHLLFLLLSSSLLLLLRICVLLAASEHPSAFRRKCRRRRPLTHAESTWGHCGEKLSADTSDFKS